MRDLTIAAAAVVSAIIGGFLLGEGDPWLFVGAILIYFAGVGWGLVSPEEFRP